MKVFLACVSLVFLAACGGGGGGGSGGTSPAPEARTLYYGYYGNRDTQLQETQNHTNLLVELGHGGEEFQVSSIAAWRKPTILGLQSQVWIGSPPFILNPNAEAQVRIKLQRLHSLGLLQYVVALYPVDEPDLTAQDNDVAFVLDMLRRVAAEFPELAGVKLAVIYAPSGRLPNLDKFDWVGIDNYAIGAQVLGATYDDLGAQLRPDQKTILIPGGYIGADPAPFTERALSDSRVAAMIPFIWYDNADPANNVIAGIRSNGMAAAYCAAGKAITKLSGGC